MFYKGGEGRNFLLLFMNFENQRETSSLSDNKKSHNKIFAVIGSAILALSILFGIGISFSSCYEIIIDEDSVCYVDDHTILDCAIDSARNIVVANLGIDAPVSTPAIEYKHVLKPFASTIDADALTQTLVSEAAWTTEGAVLDVNNGELTYTFLTESDGQAVLDALVAEALAKEQDASIISTSFLETVTLTPVSVNLNSVTSTEEALASIKAGKEAVKIHVVQKGESFWSIAKKYGISVATLQKLNPDVPEKLRIGQELQLTKLQPLINVVVNKIVVAEESIPFGEIVQESSSLLKGEYAIVTPGIEGTKSVTYQISEADGEPLSKVVLEEVVLTEPVAQVIDRGTATIATASRGGDGALNWPVSGKITSPYGYRSSGFHNGLDLGAKYGTPVVAAAGGKVTLASYSGGYGYCVLIDHGNGMKTRYAHLSKISVKVGETVLRGEQVGLIGSTGNSTGPHLHFEVIVNGNTKNPVNYLK